MSRWTALVRGVTADVYEDFIVNKKCAKVTRILLVGKLVGISVYHTWIITVATEPESRTVLVLTVFPSNYSMAYLSVITNGDSRNAWAGATNSNVVCMS